MEGATSVDDVFKRLFTNPTKLMDLVKNVGSKLDNKISERKTEKGKKTMLKKCSERTSHPKKPCVVKNKKCVSK